MTEDNFSTEPLSSSANRDDVGRSEKNTGSGDEAHSDRGANAAGPVCLTSSPPVCSFGSPHPNQRELGGADTRECASDAFEPSTCLHQTGIEDLSLAELPSQRDSGAVSSVQLETRGTTSQKIRNFQRELWCRQTIHKQTVAAKLREAGAVTLADDLELCHTETTWSICKGCSKSKPFLNRCERFYCPECQPTLSRDRERSVGWWAVRMQQPKHVVLTLRNFPRLNKRQVQWAKECFARLRRRKFAKNWQGGFYNWEITNEGKGWHLHVHALIEARYIDAVQLSAEWAKVTRGWGRIVKVLDARRVNYLKEVTKYAVKGNMLAAWSGAEILSFINAFTGVRTFGVFGSLYGKRTEWKEWVASLREKGNKCECGCTEFWYQSDFDHIHGELVPETAARPPTNTGVGIPQLSFAMV